MSTKPAKKGSNSSKKSGSNQPAAANDNHSPVRMAADALTELRNLVSNFTFHELILSCTKQKRLFDDSKLVRVVPITDEETQKYY